VIIFQGASGRVSRPDRAFRGCAAASAPAFGRGALRAPSNPFAAQKQAERDLHRKSRYNEFSGPPENSGLSSARPFHGLAATTLARGARIPGFNNFVVTIQSPPLGHCEQARETHGKAVCLVTGIKAGRTKNRKSL
jgi:hypothetical protein